MQNVKWKVKNLRMCVVCRQKFPQKELNRIQCRYGKLIKFSGNGRSFYVCKYCINDKKLVKYVSKICNISKEEAKKEIFHFPFYIVN